jgi:hypothetical protein
MTETGRVIVRGSGRRSLMVVEYFVFCEAALAVEVDRSFGASRPIGMVSLEF